MLNATKEVIARVEATTGRPVRVVADPTLKVHATVNMARDGAPFHVVSFQPNAGSVTDYLIAWQCGFILRLFENPPDTRFDFVPADTAEDRVKRQVRRSAPPHFTTVADQFASQIFRGLMLQLRSVPVGLRVDGSLSAEFPELVPAQHQSVERQLRENTQPLQIEPSIKRMFPATVYKANLAINAAFASYWAREWQQPPLLVPYRAGGHLQLGEDLLAVWDETDKSPTSDRVLIETWAQKLVLLDWFQWVAFRP